MCSTVPKWEIFEHTMQVDREIDNPFWEVDLCVILQHGECLYYADGTNGTAIGDWRMAPSDSLIGCPNNIYCLAEPGIEYLIYFAKKRNRFKCHRIANALI